MIVEGSSTGATPGITAAAIVLITGSTDHQGAVADMAATAMMIVALLLIVIIIIHLTLAGDDSIEAVFLHLIMDMVQDDGSRGLHRRIVAVRLHRRLTLTTVGITAFITIVDRLTLTTGWEDLRLRPLTTITILTPRPL